MNACIGPHVNNNIKFCYRYDSFDLDYLVPLGSFLYPTIYMYIGLKNTALL